MKKLLLAIVMLCGFVCAQAQEITYNDDLYVTVDGNTTGPYAAQVNVSLNEDGTINFSLNNFILKADGDEMPVGNIVVNNLEIAPVTDKVNTYSFNFDGILTVQEGSDPSIDFWAGPSLGELPTKMSGVLDLEHLFVNIDIDAVELLGQVIHVEFGHDPDANSILYRDDLYVTVNGGTTGPYNAQVRVSMNEDGTINFSLNNFVLVTEDGSELPIGNIFVPNLIVAPVDGKDNTFTFDFDGILTVQDGSDPSVDFWAGPNLGELPTKMSGMLDFEHLYVVIDIDAEMLGDVIHVEFGKQDYFNTTAIENVDAAKKFVGAFDLAGRKVSGNFKGIRIINGKKVVR